MELAGYLTSGGGVQTRVLVRCGPPRKPGRGQGPRRHPGSSREHSPRGTGGRAAGTAAGGPSSSHRPGTAPSHRTWGATGFSVHGNNTSEPRGRPNWVRFWKTCLMGGLPEARPSPPGRPSAPPPAMDPECSPWTSGLQPQTLRLTQPLPPAWPFVLRPQRASWHLHGDARPQFLHVLGLPDLLLTKREQLHTEGVARGKAQDAGDELSGSTSRPETLRRQGTALPRMSRGPCPPGCHTAT